MSLLLGLPGVGIATVVPERVRDVSAFSCLALIAVIELTGHGGRLPQNRRLVPQTIIRRRDSAGALQFGFEMGTGVRTFIPTALPHGLVVLVLLQTTTIGTAVAAGLGFGLGRALVRPARFRDPVAWDTKLGESRRAFSLALLAGFLAAAANLLL